MYVCMYVCMCARACVLVVVGDFRVCVECGLKVTDENGGEHVRISKRVVD